jgi:hypothetical protein
MLIAAPKVAQQLAQCQQIGQPEVATPSRDLNEDVYGRQTRPLRGNPACGSGCIEVHDARVSPGLATPQHLERLAEQRMERMGYLKLLALTGPPSCSC